jgi:hypothetical protein
MCCIILYKVDEFSVSLLDDTVTNRVISRYIHRNRPFLSRAHPFFMLFFSILAPLDHLFVYISIQGLQDVRPSFHLLHSLSLSLLHCCSLRRLFGVISIQSFQHFCYLLHPARKRQQDLFFPFFLSSLYCMEPCPFAAR